MLKSQALAGAIALLALRLVLALILAETAMPAAPAQGATRAYT